jgi:sulfite reductase (NADPH) flavoprotein alpha-component
VLLLVSSTHGEGDPPQSALNFFEFLEGRKAPQLPGLKYAVLALGDSTYEFYCEAGKRLDRRLDELGAERLIPRVDCDVDYELGAERWIKQVLAKLPRPESALPSSASSPSTPTMSEAVHDKKNPYQADVIENLVLTGRGSGKETRHIEFSLEGSNLDYQPGDALGIIAINDEAVVDRLLSQTGLDGATPVVVKDEELSLRDALRDQLEVVTATPRFIESWARLSDAAELRRLAAPEHVADRNAFLRNHHVADIVKAFPVQGVPAWELVSALRPLQPRLYSIASSLAAVPDEVHLTVSTVKYTLHGEARAGVASGHLATYAQAGTRLPVYIQSNPHFRLPANDVPIIMIGAGTGVAPYRGFLQEREVQGASGRSWLFFGDRQFRTDFLYQTEWQAHLKTGVLTRMDVAFSRDRGGKTYVQHRLKANARDVYAWLEDGAHIYVCGDAARMAPDVHNTLLEIIQQEGRLGPEEADDYLRRLQGDHRYKRDVY